MLDLLVEDDYMPRKVNFPTLDFLSDLNIYGIDGSNQKIGKSVFYFVLARAAIINFRYSKVWNIKEQCRDQEVTFFFKQWGGINKKRAGRELAGMTYDEMPMFNAV